MVKTACKGSAGVSKLPSPGRLVQLRLLPNLELVLKNKRTYEGEYHLSTVGVDGELPLDALGSPPQTEMGSFLYSGPSTDIVDTVSLLRRPRIHEHPRARHPDLPIMDPTRTEPTHGALNRTAELLAKLLSGSEDPDVTALSEAVKAKLGITEPLPKPAPLSPSPGLSTLADDLKRSRVSRLLPCRTGNWLIGTGSAGARRYLRSLAPALFILAPGQSLLLNYRTCR